MFQEIQGLSCYVVDLPVFPPPLPIHDGGRPELTAYAEALNAAIATGQISEPGKYGINLYYKYEGILKGNTLNYAVFTVKE